MQDFWNFVLRNCILNVDAEQVYLKLQVINIKNKEVTANPNCQNHRKNWGPISSTATEMIPLHTETVDSKSIYFLIVWALNHFLKNCEEFLCSLKFVLFKWPLLFTLHIHAPLMPVSAITTLNRCFPQVHAAHFAQGGYTGWKCCSTETQTTASTRT